MGYVEDVEADIKRQTRRTVGIILAIGVATVVALFFVTGCCATGSNPGGSGPKAIAGADAAYEAAIQKHECFIDEHGNKICK